ncbi:hypothetical protein [uncultured Helicobacter sp.]|uniref:hypothetical protein n=1 Tax=uncultured Helicobacter sp. TaxID=175537 RepID=UPI003750ED71
MFAQRSAVGIYSPQAIPSFCFSKNLHEMIESSLVYRKRANPSRVDEVAAPRRDLDSKKCSVCSRSGDLLPTSDTKFLL